MTINVQINSIAVRMYTIDAQIYITVQICTDVHNHYADITIKVQINAIAVQMYTIDAQIYIIIVYMMYTIHV